MYRCSDHDAVVVGIKLGDYSHEGDFDAITTIDADVWPFIATADDGTFTIHNAAYQHIAIYDITGKIRYSQVVANDKAAQFSASALGLQRGMYLVRLDTANGTRPITLKLFVR